MGPPSPIPVGGTWAAPSVLKPALSSRSLIAPRPLGSPPKPPAQAGTSTTAKEAEPFPASPPLQPLPPLPRVPDEPISLSHVPGQSSPSQQPAPAFAVYGGRSAMESAKHCPQELSVLRLGPSYADNLPHQTLNDRVLIAMVGLPARGKSYISHCIVRWLNFLGCPARLFNAGARRRKEGMAGSVADFFNSKNTSASDERERMVHGEHSTSTYYLSTCVARRRFLVTYNGKMRRLSHPEGVRSRPRLT